VFDTRASWVVPRESRRISGTVNAFLVVTW
jgi:hypothetical protein